MEVAVWDNRRSQTIIVAEDVDILANFTVTVKFKSENYFLKLSKKVSNQQCIREVFSQTTRTLRNSFAFHSVLREVTQRLCFILKGRNIFLILWNNMRLWGNGPKFIHLCNFGEQLIPTQNWLVQHDAVLYDATIAIEQNQWFPRFVWTDELPVFYKNNHWEQCCLIVIIYSKHGRSQWAHTTCVAKSSVAWKQ